MGSEIEGHLLNRYAGLKTQDLDEATQATTRGSIPHQTELINPRETFHYHGSLVFLKHITVGCVSEQGRLNICAGPSNTSFLVRLGLKGICEHHLAGSRVLLGRHWAVVQSPWDMAKVRTDESSRTLGLMMSEALIARELENFLGHPLGARVAFEPAMSLRTLSGQRFHYEALRLCSRLDKGFGLSPERLLAVQQTERRLISLLVEGHRHNYTRLLNRRSAAGPWQVRAAEEFIREHADQPLSLGDVAVVAGVSVRTLQFSFRKHRGCSPRQFLRDTRLDRVRAELLTPGDRMTVTDAAMRWGFFHFGRFAEEYEQRFGELPSTTLHASRGEAAIHYSAPQGASFQKDSR